MSPSPTRRLVPYLVPLLSLLLGCLADDGAIASDAESATQLKPSEFCTAATAGKAACKREDAVAQRFDAVRGDDAALTQLLVAMPKGGDLHSHLSGAVQTEQLIDWAVADGLCVKSGSTTLCSCADSKGKPVPGASPVGNVPEKDLIRAWSMEGFKGTVAEGRDHFFATFTQFRLVTLSHTVDMLAAVRSHAASQKEQYLELMLSLGTSGAAKAAKRVVGSGFKWEKAQLLAKRDALVADAEFQANLQTALDDLDGQVAATESALGCGTSKADPGCGVDTRYIVQVYRPSTRDQVFGQVVHAYELAKRDRRVVGFNLAGPEDQMFALGNYKSMMQAIGILREDYGRDVKVALHAGELVPELLSESSQKDLTFHIREAVLTAGADRIGHGVDIETESIEGMSPADLREEMRKRGVALEACLASNYWILGVSGKKHPLPLYLESSVPVAISTDDEGVSRSSLAFEIKRGAQEHGLGYRQVKAMVRASLEHAFLPGESLFASTDPLTLHASCTATGCKKLVAASERAKAQYRLETELATFERALAGK
ncbi:MAG: adenosine deaminase [Deltaproteobacteria bacterium]|nr:adenosine deaminase [Deltaproteobacteria bacterium]